MKNSISIRVHHGSLDGFQPDSHKNFWENKRMHGTFNTHTQLDLLNSYLYELAVVDFDYMEVKTVNPFPRRDEATSFLVKIPPNVY